MTIAEISFVKDRIKYYEVVMKFHYLEEHIYKSYVSYAHLCYPIFSSIMLKIKCSTIFLDLPLISLHKDLIFYWICLNRIAYHSIIEFQFQKFIFRNNRLSNNFILCDFAFRKQLLSKMILIFILCHNFYVFTVCYFDSFNFKLWFIYIIHSLIIIVLCIGFLHVFGNW